MDLEGKWKSQITQWISIGIFNSVRVWVCVFIYTTVPLHHEKACFLQKFHSVLLAIYRVFQVNLPGKSNILSLGLLPKLVQMDHWLEFGVADLKHSTKEAMVSGAGLKTAHGVKWEIAVSDQNSVKALQALTFISCCYTLTLLSNQRWLLLSGKGLQTLRLLSGEEFILIASEKVGVISVKIKNLQIQLHLGLQAKCPFSGGSWCLLLSYDLRYFKEAKGITEGFPELVGRSGTKNQGLTHVISLEKVEFGH